MVHAGPVIQRHAVEQRRVSLRVGDHRIGRGQHNLAKPPHAGSGGAGYASPPLRKPPDQLRWTYIRRAVPHLEQPSAGITARQGVRFHHLIATARAALPADRALGLKLHDESSECMRIRAPSRSTWVTRSWEVRPFAAYALTMAVPTRSATDGPRARANVLGPAPEIELPRAPAASAARLASRKPGKSGARTGSAIRSSIARP